MSQSPETSWPWLNAHEPFPSLSGYRPVIGDAGMIASPHQLASAIGLEIFEAGGNAVDAAIAVSAVLMVVCPMQCGPGGDAFWLIARPGERPIVLDAAGPAPAAADPERLRASGHREIPTRGGEAVTIPGAVDGWAKAHARFGSLPLEELLKPAADLAEAGFITSRHTRASFLACTDDMRAKGAFGLFGLDRAPDLYQRLKQPELASTLRLIGKTGGRAVYEGKLAAAIASAAANWGGSLTDQDLGTYEARWTDPISTQFRRLEIFTAPPPSQGFGLLAGLRAIESVVHDRLDPFATTTTHLLVEVANAALACRDAINSDEALAKVPAAIESLSDFNRTFDPNRHQPLAFDQAGSRKGDTAHFAVVDPSGMAVSAIQSLFYDFGTCIPVLPGGFTLQNRGSAFSLLEGRAGILRPGARPPHTLMPTMGFEAGKLRYVLGCMGGDGQMQTQLQVLVDLCDSGLDPQQAVSRSRWFLERGETSRVIVESGRSDVRSLEKLGHTVIEANRFEEVMGHAQVIEIRADGLRVGAADPRSDGQVAASRW